MMLAWLRIYVFMSSSVVGAQLTISSHDKQDDTQDTDYDTHGIRIMIHNISIPAESIYF